jgi:lipoprotein-anchoring transpeptidase ErfK/SrfK
MMNFREPEEFKFPTRRPWLLLVVLLVVGSLVFVRYRHEHAAAPGVAAAPAAPARGVTAPERRTQAPGPAAPVPLAAAPEASAQLARARAYESQGALAAARPLYLKALACPASPAEKADIETRLGRIDAELVLTPSAMPEKVDYLVKDGDSVDKIAKNLGASRRLIQRSNQIKDVNRIRPGDVLRVLTGQFSVLVSKSQNDMIVYMNDAFFKRYRVATGKFGRTPLGTFVVSDQIVEPTWWRPDGKEIPYGDKENILGTRWMALKATGDTPAVRGYGIHGTWDDASVGQPVSQGCVRMKNSDVEELFDIVPVGTPVVIVE